MLCKHCGLEKPLDEFTKHNETRSGRTQPCKTCKNEKTEARRNKDRQRFNEMSRGYAEKKRRAQGAKKIIDPIHTLESGELGMLCIHCQAEKPLTDFYKTKSLKRGYMQPCKICCVIKGTTRKQQNPAQHAATRESWRNKNREKLRLDHAAWRQGHPDHLRVNLHRRRARLLGLPNTFTVEERTFMLQYWGYACAVCGRQEGFFWNLADDHWIPLASPQCPGTVATNIVPLCEGMGGCNPSKHARNPTVWLRKKLGKAKAAIIAKRIADYFATVRLRTQHNAAS